MLNGAGLTDELRMLKGELSRLLKANGEDTRGESHTDVLANQIKAALNELGETLREQGGHAEHLISEQPIATLASAFALGVVVGFTMRPLK